MKQFLTTLLLLYSVLYCDLYGQVEKVGSDLRAVYRQIEGRSLAEAIAELDQPTRSPMLANGNVIVRLNGGGLENHVFIGERNTLEVLITNVNSLGGMSLGFKFSASFGAIDWVEDFGTVPSAQPHRGIVKTNSAVLLDNFFAAATVRSIPDSLLFGGACFGSPYISAHSSPVVLFSMQFDVPSGAVETSALNGGFCIDNVYMAPAGAWNFTPQSGSSFAPDFQSEGNSSESQPDAPQVCFDVIARQLCQTKFRNKNIVPVDGVESEPEYTPSQARAHHSILIDDYGEPVMEVLMVFRGDKSDLERQGVSIRRSYRYDIFAVTFPVRLLPKISRIPEIKRIYSAGSLEEKLSISVPLIHGHFSSDLWNEFHGTTTGQDVVLGIIDLGGMAWNHQDFIDSAGFTRIKWFWDQSCSTCTPHPAGYSYGREYDSLLIQFATQNQVPGLDQTGHGTAVAGIAAGNGRSSDSNYVGVAPKARLVAVKVKSSSYLRIVDAIEYVARKAQLMNEPWVVNLSLGYPFNRPTARDGSDPLEQDIDDIVTSPDTSIYGTGRVVVVASGNDGNKALHAHGTGNGTIEVDIASDPAFGIRDSITICILFSGQAPPDASISLNAPSSSSSNCYGPIDIGCMSSPFYTSGWVADTSQSTTDGKVRIFHNYFVSGLSYDDPIVPHPNDGSIAVIQIQDGFASGPFLGMRDGRWTISIDGNNIGEWDAYIIGRDTSSVYAKSFSNNSATTDRTLCSPSTANNCIAVGSINSGRQYYNSFTTGPTTSTPTTVTVDEVSTFTGLGPTRDPATRTKPDLYAPGRWVISSRSKDVADITSWAHSNNSDMWDDDEEHFLTEGGTSYAAPHVAGAAVLLLDRNPHLSWQAIRDYLKVYADFQSGTIPPSRKLNVLKTLKATTGSPSEWLFTQNGELPQAFYLHQNYPNPFNPATNIELDVSEIRTENGALLVTVEVFNILGQRVKTLLDKEVYPGLYSLQWDGTNESGVHVASGVYFCRAVYNSVSNTRKMVLAK